MKEHKITNTQLYPNFHFSLFRKDELRIQSNVLIEADDTIVNELKQQFKVVSIRKVEHTINELTGYWDTQGSGKNQKRRWVEPICNYEKNLTKYYILEIKEMKKHKILVIETSEVQEWTIEAMLDEVNRDHSDEFTPYNEDDYLDGWHEWVDGEFYKRLD